MPRTDQLAAAPASAGSSRAIDYQRAAAQLVEAYQAAGVTQVARVAIQADPSEAAATTQRAPALEPVSAPRREAPVVAAPAESAAAKPVSAQRNLPGELPAPDAGGAPLSRPQRIEALALVNDEVVACRRCADLCRLRTRTVFGVGDPEARLVFLGEAPGADEDRQGEPFVGRAGQLLTKIIEACTLRREQVYILNVLKCRPPDNRNPLPDEIENCREYLDRQLAVIRPEFICCLGKVAAQRLLEVETPIGKLRGKFFNYRGSSVLCTYHPSYLLRNPGAKKDVWEDMKLLMGRLGIDLSAR